jgi:hypothetical protein
MSDFSSNDTDSRKKALLEELAALERKSLEQKITEYNNAIPAASWRSALGNRYRQKLHPAMLLPEGLVDRRYIVPEGTPRKLYQASREWIDVHYDKHYVVEKFIIEILRPLRISKREALDTLINEIWEGWEQSLRDDA